MHRPSRSRRIRALVVASALSIAVLGSAGPATAATDQVTAAPLAETVTPSGWIWLQGGGSITSTQGWIWLR